LAAMNPAAHDHQQKRQGRWHGTHAISLSHPSAELLDTTAWSTIRCMGWRCSSPLYVNSLSTITTMARTSERYARPTPAVPILQTTVPTHVSRLSGDPERTECQRLLRPRDGNRDDKRDADAGRTMWTR
jgi:hypothetical protein